MPGEKFWEMVGFGLCICLIALGMGGCAFLLSTGVAKERMANVAIEREVK